MFKVSKQKGKSIIALLIVFLAMLYIFIKCGIYFETNDDRIKAEILSGSTFGRPDAHVIYMNYLLALPLKWLYQLTTAVPWYGLFLVGAHGLALYICVDSIIQRAGNIYETIVLAVSGYFLIYSTMYSLGKIQFTSVAALLAIAGYVRLLLGGYTKQNQILFFITQLLAFFIRQDAMLMIQPIGAMTFAGKMYMEGRLKEKAGWKQVVSCGILLGGVITLGLLGDSIGYSSDAWKDYLRYNEQRTYIDDYGGYPEYEEVKEIVQAYAITESEYHALSWYFNIKQDIPVEFLEDINKYKNAANTSKMHISDIWQGMKKVTFSDDWLAIGRRVAGMWGIAIFCCVLFRKWTMFYPLAGLLLSRTAIWSYLIYKGRMPNRVIFPLFYCELFFLFAICLKAYIEKERTGWTKGIVLLMCGLLGAVNFKSGSMQVEQCIYSNEVQKVLVKDLVELTEYCQENAQNKYILDNSSFQFCIGSAFETEIYGETNYIHGGGWFAQSPPMLKYTEEYLSNLENVYLIVCLPPEEDVSQWSAARWRMEELTGKLAVEVDRFTLSSGGEYVVLKY